jgi:hypothetical protein
MKQVSGIAVIVGSLLYMGLTLLLRVIDGDDTDTQFAFNMLVGLGGFIAGAIMYARARRALRLAGTNAGPSATRPSE